MNYDLNEEQNMLKESAHKFLAEECTSELVREMAEDEKGSNRNSGKRWPSWDGWVFWFLKSMAAPG